MSSVERFISPLLSLMSMYHRSIGTAALSYGAISWGFVLYGLASTDTLAGLANIGSNNVTYGDAYSCTECTNGTCAVCYGNSSHCDYLGEVDGVSTGLPSLFNWVVCDDGTFLVPDLFGSMGLPGVARVVYGVAAAAGTIDVLIFLLTRLSTTLKTLPLFSTTSWLMLGIRLVLLVSALNWIVLTTIMLGRGGSGSVFGLCLPDPLATAGLVISGDSVMNLHVLQVILYAAVGVAVPHASGLLFSDISSLTSSPSA